MFRHQQGAFSFPGLQFSSGELDFDQLLLQCSCNWVLPGGCCWWQADCGGHLGGCFEGLDENGGRGVVPGGLHRPIGSWLLQVVHLRQQSRALQFHPSKLYSGRTIRIAPSNSIPANFTQVGPLGERPPIPSKQTLLRQGHQESALQFHPSKLYSGRAIRRAPSNSIQANFPSCKLISPSYDEVASFLPRESAQALIKITEQV